MGMLERSGCRLTYRVVGQGPPVLFIQGVGLHGDGWLPQIQGLSAAYTCLTFDNRGIGRSQPMATAVLSVALMADDALALADAERWDRFHVVGHSMGGHIAAALALRAPERVRSLALLCTSARGRDVPPLTKSFLWTSLRSRVGTRRARRRAFLEIVLPDSMREASDLDAWAARLEPLFGHDLADTPHAVMKQIRAYRTHDATERLSRLGGLPTLVLNATEDPVAPPPLGKALARAIPGSKYVELGEAAHGVTITHATEVNHLLAELFASSDDLAPAPGRL